MGDVIGDMMDDINKYAAIWDNALANGQLKSDKKVPDEKLGSVNYFGQYHTEDSNEPMNESDIKYWLEVCRMGNPNFDEKFFENSAEAKKIADGIVKAHNPVHPTTIGNDALPKVTQNWAVGGKEHFDLEDLKVRLERLESKLNALDTEEKPTSDTQSKIDGIKKQIDDLSNSLSGDRFNTDQ